MPAIRVAMRWVAHPSTIAAALVLLVNDHILKAAFPGLITGKLSDFAGLAAAPALLALAVALIVPRLPATALAATALTLTGAGFVWVKATGAGAEAASAAWSVITGPSVILADPTDLLAVPALALAWWTWRRVRPAPDVPASTLARARLFVALPLIVLATAATPADPLPDAVLAVEEEAGEVALHTGYGITRGTPDGAWSPIEDLPDGAAEKDLSNASACAPDDPVHCYRLHEGEAIGVDETLDGGATWRTAWELPPDRWRWLYRSHELDSSNRPGIGDVLKGLDILVRAVPAGHQVVVAAGVEGLVVRSPEGEWSRVSVDAVGGAYGPSTFHAGPLPLTAFGSGASREIGYAVLLGALAMLLATTISTRRSRTPVARIWGIMSAAALAGVVPAVGFTILSGPVWTVLCPIAVLVLHAVFVFRGRALPRGRTLASLAVALLVAPAFAAPYLGWSVARPADYGVATAVAAASAALALLVSVLVTLRLFKKRVPQPRQW
ncbi:hypothetical protein AB0I28_09470 [Phytomonospora sp. NPDC050363]|uniref:hypothetical protein n=1 Tax=Phytomonospora sp. NPDC050363 TaxID=3155642 RepID=UPI0033E7FF1B